MNATLNNLIGTILLQQRNGSPPPHISITKPNWFISVSQFFLYSFSPVILDCLSYSTSVC